MTVEHRKMQKQTHSKERADKAIKLFI